MNLARTDTTTPDTQTADTSSPRSSLFLIRGPHSAAHILLAHPKRPVSLHLAGGFQSTDPRYTAWAYVLRRSTDL